MNVADYLLQKGKPASTAVLTEGASHTYEDLARASNGVARTLVDQGVGKGDRVGIFADNSLFWIASYIGALKSGAIAVPFYPTLDAPLFSGLVAFAGCTAFCIQQKYLQKFAQGIPKGTVVVLEDEALARRFSQQFSTAVAKPAERFVSVPVDDRVDLAALMFTSGSTGTPRAVMVSHRNIIANSDSIIASLDLDEHERVMSVLPFYYCFGTSLLHTHLRVGGSLVINNRFAFPQLVLDQMEATGCTGIAGVPSTYQILLRNSNFPQRALPHLRKMQQAGGKLPDVFIEELRASHPEARYYLMYGQTEATARLSCLPPEMLDAKLGSIGRGIPGVTLQVLDAQGRPVAPGETGEIVATGENVTRGYWREAEATARIFRDGALWTGDIARVDGEGYIFVVDRAKDFLKPSGHRVASKYIEDCLVRLPDVIEAAVIGVPDDVLGEAVRAFVVLRAKAATDRQMILEHCRRNLPPYAVPRETVILKVMPKNSSGKLDKLALRALREP